MGEELGHIEKPSVESFGGQRKLFVVPLVLRGNDAPDEYSEKFDIYWQQVREQLVRLEEKTGPVECIYHEAIVAGGEDGLKILEKMNTSSCSIVRERCERGARLEATDDRELAEESMDWERMLLGGFLSEKVARMVSQFYVEASRKRYDHMARRIDESLKPGERGCMLSLARARESDYPVLFRPCRLPWGVRGWAQQVFPLDGAGQFPRSVAQPRTLNEHDIRCRERRTIRQHGDLLRCPPVPVRIVAKNVGGPVVQDIVIGVLGTGTSTAYKISGCQCPLGQAS